MFCNYCGKEIEDNSKFCPGCGAALQGAAPPRQPDGITGSVNPVNVGNGLPAQKVAAAPQGFKQIMLVNTDYISGKEIQMLGLVKGSTIQCKNIGKDISQTFKNIVGGEMTAYTEMMNEARDIATQRMIGEAEKMRADAVLSVRYATSAIVAGAAEVIAYGTAVKFTD